jgi:hypothetical protein
MKSTNNFNSINQWILPFIFFFQAIFFSWFITPLGDIPDESGHYAYAVDLSKGRPFPVLELTHTGRGSIPDNLWRNWGEESAIKRVNYIVQHPPLYYILAAIPYTIAKHFTDDLTIHAHVTRSISAISLGLLVLVTFKILILLNLKQGQALLISSWLPLLPMMSHLSSGITNDVFLTLMCGLATLYLLKFLITQNLRFAYICAFWLAAAGATKMTAWILIIAYLGLLLYEIKLPLKDWLKHTLFITITAISTALVWMYRNLIAHGNPLHVFKGPPITDPQGVSLVNYFQNYPFFDWLIQHSYGLIGFSGYCLSAKDVIVLNEYCKGAQMTVATGPSYWMFIYTTVLLGAFLMISYFFYAFKNQHTSNPSKPSIGHHSIQNLLMETMGNYPNAIRWIDVTLILIASSIAILFFYYGFKFNATYSLHAYFGMSLFIFSTIVLSRFVIFGPVVEQRILAYGPIILLLFISTLFLKSHNAFDISGNLPGVQGRYLFPFFPLLIASVGLALRSHKLGLIASLAISFALVWSHLNSYSDIFIPFFNSVKL